VDGARAQAPAAQARAQLAQAAGVHGDDEVDIGRRDLVELPNADRCCGSAGVYSLTQPDMSMQLLESKMDAVRATGATIVATSNPGCMAQLEAGGRRFGPKIRVVHVVELLDKAYRA